ncbi:hypothetical protein, partial [Alkalibacterium sp. m-11]
IDKRTTGYKRRQEAQKKATETMFTLLHSLPLQKLKAQTLLFDRIGKYKVLPARKPITSNVNHYHLI